MEKGGFYGYKVHLIIDVATELPVAIIITSGNRYDGYELKPRLKKVQQHVPTAIKAVLADKGYDAGYNYLTIVEDFGALPLIPKRGQKTLQVTRQQPLEPFLLDKPVNSLQETSKDPKTREKAYRDSPPLARTSSEWQILQLLFSFEFTILFSENHIQSELNIRYYYFIRT